MSKPRLLTVTNTAGKAQIRIIGRISDWRNNSDDFERTINDLIAQGVKDVDLYIKTEGGSCIEANEIANIIKRFPGTITGHGGAIVASAGTYIAVKCASFSMPSNGLFMIHKPYLDTGGNIDQIEADLKLLRTITDNYKKAFAAKTKKTEEAIDSLWRTDFWMGAEEAKKEGFIDSISDEEQIDEDLIQNLKSNFKSLPSALINFQVQDLKQNIEMDKKTIAVALAMVTNAADAEKLSDAEVIAAISAMSAKAAKADELQRKLEQIEADRSAEKIKNLLDKAVTDKKIMASERAHMEKLAKNDFASVEEIIKARPAMEKISSQINSESSETVVDHKSWTYKDYQEKDPKALVALAKDDLPHFKKLFKNHYGTEYQD